MGVALHRRQGDRSRVLRLATPKDQMVVSGEVDLHLNEELQDILPWKIVSK